MTSASMKGQTNQRRVIYRSPLRYPGGKQKAISRISNMLPGGGALEYREPMVGGGSVFFHARSIGFADRYWVNDNFQELICFWKTVQSGKSCRRLMKELEQFRSGFESAEAMKEFFYSARSEEPIDQFRAAFLFFFFNRVTFSGTTRAGGFSSQASRARFTASSIERLSSLPIAFDGVRISHGDYERVIKEPGRDVFIFLDPPYLSARRLYGRDGSLHEFDHERLARLLRDTEHRFLITYDDCHEIRKLYRWARVEEWQLQYGMNNCSSDNSSKIGSELFICNY